MSPSPPGLDLSRLRDYLDAAMPGTVRGALHADVIPGGRSNLTYFVDDGLQRWVLRRPPLGHVMATAHNMSREYRVMAAMAGTEVPCPEVVLLCQDPEVIGTPFFMMERVDGVVVRSTQQSKALGSAGAAHLSACLIDCLATLHQVAPDSVGLADFGRPEGFLSRQVDRWSQQLASSRSRTLPGVDALGLSLAADVPRAQRVSIVHGDYRLENVIVSPDAEIEAVLDWEMATLGDPLADLGLLYVYWDAVPALGTNPIAEAIDPSLGFLSADELVARYSIVTGHRPEDLSWYVGLGAFKLAVVLESIHYRYELGLTVGDRYDEIGALVAPLAEYGLATLEKA